jgi:hypothetical protein
VWREGRTNHVADFSGATGPGEEDWTAAAAGELAGGAACAAQKLAGFDGAGGGEAGKEGEENGVGVHDAGGSW